VLSNWLDYQDNIICYPHSPQLLLINSINSNINMKYLLLHLTVLTCLVAVVVRSQSSLAPSLVSQECKDETCDVNNITEGPAPGNRGFGASISHYAGYTVQDTVEVYDPKILESHAFYARITNIVQSHNGKIKFHITADIPSLSLEEDASEHLVFVEMDPSSVKPFEPYEFNTPVTCDWSGDDYGNYGKLLVPCRILSHEKNEDFELYHVLSYIGDELQYRRLPLSRIRRPMTSSNSGIPNQFKPGMIPPYQMPIDGSTELLRGVAELYGEQSMFAESVIILGYNDIAASPQFGYHAAYTISGTHYAGVAQEFLHPYKIYRDGTKAYCNFGGMENEMDLRPCTILSHTEKEVGYLSYTVSHEKQEDKEEVMKTELSFSKIQRVRRDQAMM
jgi:hypothetical protein